MWHPPGGGWNAVDDKKVDHSTGNDHSFQWSMDAIIFPIYLSISGMVLHIHQFVFLNVIKQMFKFHMNYNILSLFAHIYLYFFIYIFLIDR